MPLLIACLPSLIEQTLPVPGMAKHEGVRCAGMGLPKEYTDEYETGIAVVSGRRSEVMKCARVSADKWICHPGGPPLVNALVELDLPQEGAPKKPRLGGGGALHRLRAARKGPHLDSIMACAHYRAAVCRALQQKREPDMAEAARCFNTDAFTWGRVPKTVFVFWSYKSPEGGRCYDVTEAPFKGLCA